MLTIHTERSKGLRTPLKTRRQFGGDEGAPLTLSQQGGSSLTAAPDALQQAGKNKRQRTLFACSQDSEV